MKFTKLITALFAVVLCLSISSNAFAAPAQLFLETNDFHDRQGTVTGSGKSALITLVADGAAQVGYYRTDNGGSHPLFIILLSTPASGGQRNGSFYMPTGVDFTILLANDIRQDKPKYAKVYVNTNP